MDETQATISVEARVTGKRKAIGAPWHVTLPPEFLQAAAKGEQILRLRHLIDHIVRAEVRAFRQRQEERRLAATHLLSLLNLPETQTTFLALLADPDLRVALHAFASIRKHELAEQHNKLFEQLQQLLARIGQKSQTIQSGIWPWLTISSSPAALLSTMLQCLAERDPRCLLPHLPLKQVEYVLGWPHFEDAVWWIYAHTRGSNWSVDDEIRETWQAQVAERTVVSADELLAGAVDVAWFQKSYNGLGAERWEHVYAAAKYASDGTGHGRARLYADAMSGRVDASELHRRMSDKRQQDTVRAAELVPLPVDEQARTIEIAERYQAFQEFKRSGQKFGA